VPTIAITVVLAWGVLAFGAVYPWAFWPLVAAIVACTFYYTGSLFQVQRKHWAWAVALMGGAVAAQLVPLSHGTLAWASPAIPTSLALLDVRFATGVARSHGLSLAPAETFRGLAFLVFGTLWTISCAAIFRREQAARTFVRNLIYLGSFVALIGLAQKATFNGKLLWFWEPTFGADNSFGPLVNRNHFAGWMLLVTALAVGWVCGLLALRHKTPTQDWRSRVLGLDSTAASRILLTTAAVVMMVCSILWTMSRSGIAATGVALTILTCALAYRSRGRAQTNLVVGLALFVTAGLVAWRGADTLVDWYGNTSTLEWRFQLWNDTLPALRDFWTTGSGFNTYGTVMLLYPRTDQTVFPREAHSDYLQLAVEGGLLVGIPVLLLIVAIAREAVQRLRQPQDEMTWWIRMGAVAGICGMAVQELTEFSLQIPGVALMFATCVAIAIHEPAPVESRRRLREIKTRPELVTSL
jgi:O-antigen ligase